MKPRADSWYAFLDEEILWKLYTLARRGAQWFEVVETAKRDFGLTQKVSRSGYYRWLDFMREQESERRLAQARIAALEANDLAKAVGLKDDKAIAAYKSLAAEIALKGDAKTASRFLSMAMSLTDRLHHERELSLRSDAQNVKEEELRLAREKFEFDAAKKAMELAAEIKGIASDDSLDDDDKIQKVREALFG